MYSTYCIYKVSKALTYIPYKMSHRKGEVWELQLKGSGKTPYSRYDFQLFFLSFSLISPFQIWPNSMSVMPNVTKNIKISLIWNFSMNLTILMQVRRWSSCDPFFCERVPVQWSHALPGCSHQQGCQVRGTGDGSKATIGFAMWLYIIFVKEEKKSKDLLFFNRT